MKNSKITVTLIKSSIGTTEDVRSTLLGLGLKKLNKSKTLDNTPAVRGMIKKVITMLKVEE